MAKFRSIQTSFWSDSKIVDDFSPEDRYFYLYLLTNEKSNQLGCYEISKNQMCRDTGYNRDTVDKLVDRFEKNHHVIIYDNDTKEIFIKNWHKYNWLNSWKTKICIDREFSEIKSNKIIDEISPLYAPYMPQASNNNKKNNKNNNNNNNKKKKNNKKSESGIVANATTHAPSLELIIDYGKSLNVDEDYCEKFFNHYESIGWVNGTGQPIKNWKLIFKNWIAKDNVVLQQEEKEYL